MLRKKLRKELKKCARFSNFKLLPSRLKNHKQTENRIFVTVQTKVACLLVYVINLTGNIKTPKISQKFVNLLPN